MSAGPGLGPKQNQQNVNSTSHQRNATSGTGTGTRPRPQPIAGTPPPDPSEKCADQKMIQQTCTLFGLDLVSRCSSIFQTKMHILDKTRFFIFTQNKYSTNFILVNFIMYFRSWYASLEKISKKRTWKKALFIYVFIYLSTGETTSRSAEQIVHGYWKHQARLSSDQSDEDAVPRWVIEKMIEPRVQKLLKDVFVYLLFLFIFFRQKRAMAKLFCWKVKQF